MGGEMDPVMKQKVENDAAAYLRSICRQARPQQRDWPRRPCAKASRSPREKRWTST